MPEAQASYSLIDQRCSSYFSEEELLQLTKSLIKINSENQPGTSEKECAEFIYQYLHAEGIEVWLEDAAPERPNVVARVKGAYPGPIILLNGHSDVVPGGSGWETDPFCPVVENGKLFGRGASDMKGGVAAIVYTLVVLKRSGCDFRGEVLLLINVDEERVNVGMRHFIAQSYHADYAIVAEPTNNQVCLAHKGIARYRVSTSGLSQHAAITEGVRNAIDGMTPVLVELQHLSKQVATTSDELLGRASLTITQIRGGDAPNKIPASCEIELDRRLLPEDTEESVMAELKVLSDTYQADIEQYLYLPASSIQPQHAFVAAASKSYEATYGVQAEPAVFGAFCEAPFLSVYKNIPTIIVGPGSLSQAHMANEYCHVDEIYGAAAFYINLIQTQS